MFETALQDDAKILRPAHGPATLAIKKEEAKKKTEEPESYTPAPMPAGLEAAVGKGDRALKIRLQCWDCPGQQEYALLNLLYFAQGIYVLVCDMSEEPEKDQINSKKVKQPYIYMIPLGCPTSFSFLGTRSFN